LNIRTLDEAGHAGGVDGMDVKVIPATNATT